MSSQNNDKVIVLGEEIDQRNFPLLYKWARANLETLEEQLKLLAGKWHEGSITSAMQSLESYLAMTESTYCDNCKSMGAKECGCNFSTLAPDGDDDMWALMLCDKCNSYYLDCYHDHFAGNDTFSFKRKVTAEEIEMVKKLVSNCKDPYNQHCRCKDHEKLARSLYKGFKEYQEKEMQKAG